MILRGTRAWLIHVLMSVDDMGSCHDRQVSFSRSPGELGTISRSELSQLLRGRAGYGTLLLQGFPTMVRDGMAEGA